MTCKSSFSDALAIPRMVKSMLFERSFTRLSSAFFFSSLLAGLAAAAAASSLAFLASASAFFLAAFFLFLGEQSGCSLLFFSHLLGLASAPLPLPRLSSWRLFLSLPWRAERLQQPPLPRPTSWPALLEPSLRLFRLPFVASQFP